MAILISSKNFENSKKIGSYYLNSNFKIILDRYYYISIGEVYNYTFEEVVSLLINKNEQKFNSINGEFALIVYDSLLDNVFFLNDKAGREIVYYNASSQSFSMSNDFWSILCHENKTIKDINTLELKTQLFFSSSVTYKTIINNINIFENGVYSVYHNQILEKKKYWLFKQERNNLTESEKFDMIDKKLFECFDTIKKLNSKDTVYGVGISGGMDSRIIPHYALKNGMKIKSFIIGEEKPHFLLKSNDHTSSDRIVKHFELEHIKLEYNEISYEDKNLLDCLYNPIGSSQIFKIPNIDKLNFDVLLTGASGFIVGSSPFYTKNRYKNLIEILFVQQSDLKLKTNFYRIKKALNYIVGTKFKLEIIPNDLKGVITHKEIEQIKQEQTKYINSLSNLSKTEQLMNYAVGVLGQKNKSGAFESLINKKKNYTPYIPFLLDIVSTWSDDDLYDRKLFEDFIKVRLAELSSIRQQSHKPSVDIKNPNIFHKLYSLFIYVIRGQGVMNYNNWVKQREFKKFVNEELNKYNYIGKYIDIDYIKKLAYKNQLNGDVLANCIKLNRILYMIDNKKAENGICQNK